MGREHSHRSRAALAPRPRRRLRGRRHDGDRSTVLAPANDPYRQDTPTGHAEGRWFAKHFTAAIEERGKPTLHLRGVHYAIVAAGRIKKPNGKPYRNTDADWEWLQSGPAKCARWLGYVPFDAITDNRADPPTIRETVGVATPLHLGVARGRDSRCRRMSRSTRELLRRRRRVKPYRLVIFGEKSSLADVVAPIADAVSRGSVSRNRRDFR